LVEYNQLTKAATLAVFHAVPLKFVGRVPGGVEFDQTKVKLDVVSSDLSSFLEQCKSGRTSLGDHDLCELKLKQTSGVSKPSTRRQGAAKAQSSLERAHEVVVQPPKGGFRSASEGTVEAVTASTSTAINRLHTALDTKLNQINISIKKQLSEKKCAKCSKYEGQILGLQAQLRASRTENSSTAKSYERVMAENTRLLAEISRLESQLAAFPPSQQLCFDLKGESIKHKSSNRFPTSKTGGSKHLCKPTSKRARSYHSKHCHEFETFSACSPATPAETETQTPSPQKQCTVDFTELYFQVVHRT
jgi:hypothetical protein